MDFPISKSLYLESGLINLCYYVLRLAIDDSYNKLGIKRYADLYTVSELCMM